MVSGFPFDTIKVRLQASPGRYSGAWDCFVRICRQEGVRHGAPVCVHYQHTQPQQPRALFRGLSPPLIGGAVETGINYAVYASVLGHISVCRLCSSGTFTCTLSRPALRNRRYHTLVLQPLHRAWH